MNFTPTETQAQIADMIRDFADKNIRPKMMEWDESQEFPIHVFKALGELGLMGVSYSYRIWRLRVIVF
jgi:alkylation response protein AidB-like acyl-CoA dehydrogenase